MGHRHSGMGLRSLPDALGCLQVVYTQNLDCQKAGYRHLKLMIVEKPQRPPGLKEKRLNDTD